MSQVFGTLCCFSSTPFLKQLASHVSADTLHVYSSILGIETFFWKVLKFFA